MRIVLITTRDQPFGGVLATAYHQSGGPDIERILVVPAARGPRFSALEKASAARHLLGWRGVWTMLRARPSGLLSANERRAGVGARWLATMSRGRPIVETIESVNSEASLRRLASLQADVVVAIGVPQILGAAALTVPRLGAINVHHGRLPAYRGHFATFWEVLHGESRLGVSLHEMVARVDSGRLLAAGETRKDDHRSLPQALIAKKQLSGSLLARLLEQTAARGRLEPMPELPAWDRSHNNYFSWPTADDLRRFSWKADTERSRIYADSPGPGRSGPRS